MAYRGRIWLDRISTSYGTQPILINKWQDSIPNKTCVISISVYEMENLKTPERPSTIISNEVANRYLRLQVYYDKAKSILSSLRSYIYIQVSDIWAESIREKDRINLLGQNYRLITDKLSTLNTEVGNELLAATDNLFSNNSAHWSLCALGCRQIIIRLSKLIWKVPGDNYEKRDGKNIEVKMDKEKNRLLAYIDHFYRIASGDIQNMLEEAEELVHFVYNEGSKGKNPIRREDAQTLLVKTFHFVDLLDRATGLESIAKIT